jgi:hypothetical protein
VSHTCGGEGTLNSGGRRKDVWEVLNAHLKTIGKFDIDPNRGCLINDLLDEDDNPGRELPLIDNRHF